MTYQDTLDYLYNSLPMYHRVGAAAYKADIANTVSLMDHLDHPERKFRSIHVAGTNGKGSVSHLLASILMQAGYRVGLYTSPHLVDFRERIRINGDMIPPERVTAFVQQHKEYMQSLGLSFFEMTVGLAFDYFAAQKVDIAVVEVGMGGRLDSTDVITPLISVITNIGFDHTQFLGHTLAAIAGEKAGIIKQGVPVVIGQTHPETSPVFRQKAETMGAPIYFADQHYRIEPLPTAHAASTLEDNDYLNLRFKVRTLDSQATTYPSTYTSPLSGSYQLHNLATLFQVLQLLPQVGLGVSDPDIVNGIARVVADTGLHGRWERLDRKPLTICETAHNADGVEAMLAKLDQIPYRRLHLIYGCVNDKDYMHILRMLPTAATTFYYTQPSVPRGLPVQQLAEAAASCGMAGEAFPIVADAIRAARAAAQPDLDLVLVTGSIFLVADAVEYYSHLQP